MALATAMALAMHACNGDHCHGTAMRGHGRHGHAAGGAPWAVRVAAALYKARPAAVEGLGAPLRDCTMSAGESTCVTVPATDPSEELQP